MVIMRHKLGVPVAVISTFPVLLPHLPKCKTYLFAPLQDLRKVAQQVLEAILVFLIWLFK